MAFTSELVGSILSLSTRVRRVDQLNGQLNAQPKIVGFLRVLRFPPGPTLTGWVRIINNKITRSQFL